MALNRLLLDHVLAIPDSELGEVALLSQYCT